MKKSPYRTSFSDQTGIASGQRLIECNSALNPAAHQIRHLKAAIQCVPGNYDRKTVMIIDYFQARKRMVQE
jgi:hypothetical protein